MMMYDFLTYTKMKVHTPFFFLSYTYPERALHSFPKGHIYFIYKPINFQLHLEKKHRYIAENV